jgi:hypothetical protein
VFGVVVSYAFCSSRYISSSILCILVCCGYSIPNSTT